MPSESDGSGASGQPELVHKFAMDKREDDSRTSSDIKLGIHREKSSDMPVHREGEKDILGSSKSSGQRPRPTPQASVSSQKLASIPEDKEVTAELISADKWRELYKGVESALKSKGAMNEPERKLIASIHGICTDRSVQDVLIRLDKKEKAEFLKTAYWKFFLKCFAKDPKDAKDGKGDDMLLLSPAVYKNHGPLSSACLWLLVWFVDGVTDDSMMKQMLRLVLPKVRPTMEHIMWLVERHCKIARQADDVMEFIEEHALPFFSENYVESDDKKYEHIKSVAHPEGGVFIPFLRQALSPPTLEKATEKNGRKLTDDIKAKFDKNELYVHKGMELVVRWSDNKMDKYMTGGTVRDRTCAQNIVTTHLLNAVTDPGHTLLDALSKVFNTPNVKIDPKSVREIFDKVCGNSVVAFHFHRLCFGMVDGWSKYTLQLLSYEDKCAWDIDLLRLVISEIFAKHAGPGDIEVQLMDGIKKACQNRSLWRVPVFLSTLGKYSGRKRAELGHRALEYLLQSANRKQQDDDMGESQAPSLTAAMALLDIGTDQSAGEGDQWRDMLLWLAESSSISDTGCLQMAFDMLAKAGTDAYDEQFADVWWLCERMTYSSTLSSELRTWAKLPGTKEFWAVMLHKDGAVPDFVVRLLSRGAQANSNSLRDALDANFVPLFQKIVNCVHNEQDDRRIDLFTSCAVRLVPCFSAKDWGACTELVRAFLSATSSPSKHPLWIELNQNVGVAKRFLETLLLNDLDRMIALAMTLVKSFSSDNIQHVSQLADCVGALLQNILDLFRATPERECDLFKQLRGAKQHVLKILAIAKDTKSAVLGDVAKDLFTRVFHCNSQEEDLFSSNVISETRNETSAPSLVSSSTDFPIKKSHWQDASKRASAKVKSKADPIPDFGHQDDRLVLTDTTKINIAKVISMSETGRPILLQGDTGVGKSATVEAAARRQGKQLERFNMSSRIEIEDFIGKVQFNSDRKPEFIPGILSRAAEQGLWLLLDELNLAPPELFTILEAVIDNKPVMLNDSSSSSNSSRTVQIHPDFRIFATQNPNTGNFRGKREDQTKQLTDRFLFLNFDPLPKKEWEEVVAELLERQGIKGAPKLAETMVDLHFKVQKKLQESVQSNSSLCKVSIRELLKWVQGFQFQSHDRNREDENEWPRILALQAFCVYGGRFDERGRDVVRQVIRNRFKNVPKLSGDLDWKMNAGDFTIFYKDQPDFGSVTIESPFDGDDDMTGTDYEHHDMQIPSDFPDQDVHEAVKSLVLSNKFGKKYGLYLINQSWRKFALQAVRGALEEGKDGDDLSISFALTYCARFRHASARGLVRDCIVKAFCGCQYWEITAEQIDGQLDLSSTADKPYVLSARHLETMRLVVRSLSMPHPQLICGDAAVGKTDMVMFVSTVAGKPVHQSFLTAESEPSELIGSLQPTANPSENSAPFEWSDGTITRAARYGHHALCDNLESTDACVNERLNSITEVPPVLVLAERAEGDVVNISGDFRFFATATLGNSFDASFSDALANRMTAIYLPNVSDDEQAFMSELEELARCMLPEEAHPALAAGLCWQLWQARSIALGECKITFRTLVNLLDNAFKIFTSCPKGTQEKFILWNAFDSLISDSAVRSSVLQYLSLANQTDITFDFLSSYKNVGVRKTHILTPSRRRHASFVACAVLCKKPVLLEGLPAVGKTALIGALAEASDRQLFRVNNTETTSIQDYFGTYIPCGSAFEFQKGQLYQALEQGDWFLADELNLADTAVLSALIPILEGRREVFIPGSNATLAMHP
eukprot:gene794-183_t